jgi:hypothetical protein
MTGGLAVQQQNTVTRNGGGCRLGTGGDKGRGQEGERETHLPEARSQR